MTILKVFQSLALSVAPHRAATAAGGFLLPPLASRGRNCYNPVSPRTGKLRATFEFRSLRAWPHRSDEKAASPAVSCVGRRSAESQDVADMPRWQRRWVTPLRPTNGEIPRPLSSDEHYKTGQRRPATRWAMQRKLSVRDDSAARQTKDLPLGLTERPACHQSLPFAHRNARAPDGQTQTWPDMVVVFLASAFPLYRMVRT